MHPRSSISLSVTGISREGVASGWWWWWCVGVCVGWGGVGWGGVGIKWRDAAGWRGCGRDASTGGLRAQPGERPCLQRPALNKPLTALVLATSPPRPSDPTCCGYCSSGGPRAERHVAQALVSNGDLALHGGQSTQANTVNVLALHLARTQCSSCKLRFRQLSSKWQQASCRRFKT